jgi:hypothetical protein
VIFLFSLLICWSFCALKQYPIFWFSVSRFLLVFSAKKQSSYTTNKKENNTYYWSLGKWRIHKRHAQGIGNTVWKNEFVWINHNKIAYSNNYSFFVLNVFVFIHIVHWINRKTMLYLNDFEKYCIMLEFNRTKFREQERSM